jgi:hypothetical protein
MHKISSAALYTVINRESRTNGAHFTIRSIKTGKDFTYKITRSEFKEKWYTQVHVEIGYLEFVRLGTYSDGKITNKGNVVETPAALGIAFILEKVEMEKFELLDTLCDIFHLGKCLVCGKTLTDSNSIEIGLGPKCRNKI